MKILYAMQAVGIGQISRASEIIPLLEKKCELDILISGTQSCVELDHFVKYRRKGLSFQFGKKGGIDFLATLKKLRSKKFLDEIKSFPIDQYDLVINDFEPISAWASKIKNIPCVAMSHQYAVLHAAAPRPERFDPMARLVLRYYAPCKSGIGFHFKKIDENIFEPIIRSAIRNAYVRNLGHYTVYLPAYHDEKLVKILSQFKDKEWHIFSHHCKRSYGKNNCWIRAVNCFDFTGSFINCEGIITGAGFETPAEALFMGKKIMIVPRKQQYEQHCNAAALKDFGVPVIKSLRKKHYHKIERWLRQEQNLQFTFPDQTEAIIDSVLEKYLSTNEPSSKIDSRARPFIPFTSLAPLNN